MLEEVPIKEDEVSKPESTEPIAEPTADPTAESAAEADEAETGINDTNWVPDSATNECFVCKKEFSFLV
jgi:hypothetical protein